MRSEQKITDNSGGTTSPWGAMGAMRSPSAGGGDMRTNVCVVGAGIAGLTTAYLLAREGRSVVVLDDGPIGGGDTGRTTAHLSNALDDRYYNLERLFGVSGARLAAESHTKAIDKIEEIVRDEKIDCDFERLDGYLFVPPDGSMEVLEREIDAARRAGLAGVEWVDRAPIADFDTGRCLRFPNQAQFSPLKYLVGLATAVLRDGGNIQTGTHADEIVGGEPVRVTTRDGRVVTAEAIVVATNSPVNDTFLISSRQSPYRTYAIGAHVPIGSVTKALYWDTADPYHYVRLKAARPANSDYDLLIVGGEDHRVGENNDGHERFAELYRWTRRRFTQLGRIEFQWSGQIMEPTDGLAFIGRMPLSEPNVFVVTGDSGHGMTHGTIAGLLLTDLILGRQNRWADLYNPSRVKSTITIDFVNENLSVLAHYTDWLNLGDIRSSREIQTAREPFFVGDLRKSLPTVTMGLHFTSASQSVRIWAVSSRGILPNKAGTVRATVLVLTRRGTSSTVQQIATSYVLSKGDSLWKSLSNRLQTATTPPRC
jgi:glycine/D-amino acid oxidase-like deaminating enzyme